MEIKYGGQFTAKQRNKIDNNKTIWMDHYYYDK